MRIELPDLPYPASALEPWISARTVQTHHGKHHRAYVDKVKALVAKARSRLNRSSRAPRAIRLSGCFSTTPRRPGTTPSIGARCVQIAGRRRANTANGPRRSRQRLLGQFGSGWAWLVRAGAELKVMTTANADTPIVHGLEPLLVIDVSYNLTSNN